MKRVLIGLAFGLILASQPYGRPSYAAPGMNAAGGYSFAARIARGERLGLLTPRESARLWDKESELRFATERALRGGYGLSHHEWKRITKMRAQLDREIAKQLRDRDRDYRPGPGRW